MLEQGSEYKGRAGQAGGKLMGGKEGVGVEGEKGERGLEFFTFRPVSWGRKSEKFAGISQCPRITITA